MVGSQRAAPPRSPTRSLVSISGQRVERETFESSWDSIAPRSRVRTHPANGWVKSRTLTACTGSSPRRQRVGETLALFERNLPGGELPVLTDQKTRRKLP